MVPEQVLLSGKVGTRCVKHMCMRRAPFAGEGGMRVDDEWHMTVAKQGK